MSCRIVLVTAGLVGVTLCPFMGSDDRKPAAAKPAGGEAELVEQVLAARRQYQQSLANLYELYAKTGDKERAKWVEEELKGFHLLAKPSYRLDVQDVPPPTLE